jgi:hypothetical protein
MLPKDPSKHEEYKTKMREKVRDSEYMRKRTEEQNKKIGLGNKGRRAWNKGLKGVQTSWCKGKRFSEEHKKNISLANIGKHQGKLSGTWKGGISYLPYCYKFNNKRKKAVREFFDYLCICTGEPEYKNELNVHHVDHDKEQGCNGKPFNLVPMNNYHHTKEIYNQEEYAAYINKTLREGFKWGIWNELEYINKVMYDE